MYTCQYINIFFCRTENSFLTSGLLICQLFAALGSAAAQRSSESFLQIFDFPPFLLAF